MTVTSVYFVLVFFVVLATFYFVHHFDNSKPSFEILTLLDSAVSVKQKLSYSPHLKRVTQKFKRSNIANFCRI